MNERKLLRQIYRKFPKNLSEVWDFPGYQCGLKSPEKEIKKILLCLDFTEDVLEEAKTFHPDLILTHHPFFFGKKSDVLEADCKKIYLEHEVNQLGCSIYSFHTNFDKAENGMNDTIISLLGYEKEDVASDGLMRTALIDEHVTMQELLSHLARTFSFDHLEYIQSNQEKIHRIALIAGGGSSDYMEALSLSADCYLSGDCAHHTRLDMRRYGLNYIDLPHEIEEKGFLIGMKKALLEIDPNLEVDSYSFEKYFDLFIS